MLMTASRINYPLQECRWEVLSPEKKRSTGRDMFAQCDSWWRGQGAAPHRGAGGEDWNATAECQTLCPDGIITDSSVAELHNSASSLPQQIRSIKTGNFSEKHGVRIPTLDKQP